ncbi:MAG: hypothetical protein JWN18_438 [Parcubacteria group bacterium]|nr:hypothetical protein [Parcubacteria group bacterium]
MIRHMLRYRLWGLMALLLVATLSTPHTYAQTTSTTTQEVSNTAEGLTTGTTTPLFQFMAVGTTTATSTGTIATTTGNMGTTTATSTGTIATTTGGMGTTTPESHPIGLCNGMGMWGGNATNTPMNATSTMWSDWHSMPFGFGSTTASTTDWCGRDGLVMHLMWLKMMYPGDAVQIQWLIDNLGMGTTTPGGSGTTTPPVTTNRTGAWVDQSGHTYRAGGTIDFNGRNFGHEETVTITLNGQTVRTAHADGGGNFSTGSMTLPGTIGEYLYIFRGENSGDVLSVPIHLIQ